MDYRFLGASGFKVPVLGFGAGTFDAIDAARKAVAHLEFEDGGDFFVCSGGLLNDAQSSGTPYLLTANHCFSDQATASTLEAFWDFRTASCNGAVPNPNSLPRSNGAALLARGSPFLGRLEEELHGAR